MHLISDSKYTVCSPCNEKDRWHMTETKLTKDDNGKTVEVRVGESVVIELPENPTTGYVWTLDVKGGIGTASLSDSPYTAAKNSGIGGGGTRKFTIKVQSSGVATVDMKLKNKNNIQKWIQYSSEMNPRV